MPILNLNTATAAQLQQSLAQHRSVVACLCAAWCDVCNAYLPKFTALAQQFPELLFLWIDVEDQAALVGDLDIDNFPTLLIQHQDTVSYFGTMQPDTLQLRRIVQSQLDLSESQLQQLANSGATQRGWQIEANLRRRMAPWPT